MLFATRPVECGNRYAMMSVLSQPSDRARLQLVEPDWVELTSPGSGSRLLHPLSHPDPAQHSHPEQGGRRDST